MFHLNFVLNDLHEITGDRVFFKLLFSKLMKLRIIIFCGYLNFLPRLFLKLKPIINISLKFQQLKFLSLRLGTVILLRLCLPMSSVF